MIKPEILATLHKDMESDRVERKASGIAVDKICQAICAFANDLPNHGEPGVVFIGVNDDGTCTGLKIEDQLLQNLASYRADGNIIPFPTMVVQKHTVNGCECAAVIVMPSDAPPVRYKGNVWIRVGPRRAIATLEEERRLSEKRKSRDLPFDVQGLPSMKLEELDTEYFSKVYLPSAIARETLDKNGRSVEQQLASLRFMTSDTPARVTVIGALVLGKDPRQYVPCAYVQFLRIEGTLLTDPIRHQAEIGGSLETILKGLDEIFKANISIATDIKAASTEVKRPDYPIVALQQLARNAVMHRTYEGTNAPIRISWFSDRIEIQNPGGPFGQVSRQNFGNPGITDYRNPHVAEAMKTLGYVQRFGIGIQTAKDELKKNGNPDLNFVVEDAHIMATVRRRP